MEFLIGSEDEFFKFLNSINSSDNVAILTHTDLDGITSGVFLEKMLESKKIPVKFVEFIAYENNVIKNISDKLKQNKISKLFISDISMDNLALEDFESLKKQMDIFLIDHHPINPLLKNKKNIVKAKSEDCAALILYDLGKDMINQEEWQDLICATMIAEFSYKDKDNLKFIQSIYPNITENNILDSEPGKIYSIISSALTYNSDNLKRVYDLVSKRDIRSLEKYHNIIQTEIKKEITDFWKNAEYFSDKRLYFYYFKPKYAIRAIVSTNVSIQKPEDAFVIISEDDKPDMLNVSARNQNHSQDMNLLLKKAIQGLENANAGGHIPAAGARFMKKDLNKFKENLLR
jgi:single-stranded DNA-specific DHH superfamily exonuclease